MSYSDNSGSLIHIFKCVILFMHLIKQHIYCCTKFKKVINTYLSVHFAHKNYTVNTKWLTVTSFPQMAMNISFLLVCFFVPGPFIEVTRMLLKRNENGSTLLLPQINPGIWWGPRCSAFKFSVLCFFKYFVSRRYVSCVQCCHGLLVVYSWLLLRLSLALYFLTNATG